MHIVAIGIVIAILLFKIYPSKSKSDVKNRTVQTILIFTLVVALIIAFKFSFMLMKFVIGMIIGAIGLYFLFKKKQRQVANVVNTANAIKKFSDKN